MSGRRLELRRLAEQDLDRGEDYYFAEGGLSIAEAFLDAVKAGFRQVSHFPESGSPRYGQSLRINGLRHWQIERFPWLIVYLPYPDHIEVIRILHASRDIPSWLQGPE